jgi:hypothetical protein
MNKTERSSRPTNIGCLPATVFALLVAAPLSIATVMGECLGEDGHLGGCPNKGVELLVIVPSAIAHSVLIVWSTNTLARALQRKGRGSGLAILAGFALAAALGYLSYTLLRAYG